MSQNNWSFVWKKKEFLIEVSCSLNNLVETSLDERFLSKNFAEGVVYGKSA